MARSINVATFLVACVSLALHAPKLEAMSVQWVTDASGAWNVASNWSSNPTLPGINDDVTIDRPLAAITVTHSQGTDSIRSLSCSESLVLSGGSLTVGGASQVTGSFSATQGAALTASGSSASFTTSSQPQLSGSSLYATGGGKVNLPLATSYVYPGANAFSNAYFKADGTGSSMDLSGLTTLKGSTGAFSTVYVQALNGGNVDLHSLPLFDTGAAQFLADGPSSRIDLSGMTHFGVVGSSGQPSSITARNGGAVLIGNLTSVDKLNLVIDGTGTMATGQIVSYTGGTATVSGVSPDFSGMTNIDGAGFRVSGGATVAVPNAISYLEHFNVAFKNDYLTADGAGSKLDLSALTTLKGGTYDFNQLTIQATAGGRVDLHSLPKYDTGSVQILADGINSVVDLSGLTTFTASGTSNGPCSVTARNGGTVLIGNLTSVDKLNLVIDGTGTMATGQIVSYTGGTATVSGVSPDFSSLANVAGSTFTVAGVTLDLSQLTSVSTATFNLSAGATVKLDNAANVDAASFKVSSGATVAAPKATSYVDSRISAWANDTFSADGANSKVDLSTLTTLKGSTSAFSIFAIQATGGGRVDLRNVPTFDTGTAQVLADGTNSVVDLSGLATFTPGNTFGKTSSITARNGGTVLLGSGMVTVSGAAVMAAAGGTITAGGLQIQGGASLGGAGSITARVILAGGNTSSTRAIINLVDGAPGTLTLSDPNAADTVLALGGAAGNSSILNFEVGTTSDRLLISYGKLLVNPGGATINITPLSGLHAGIYDLLDFPDGQASGLDYLTLGATTLPGGYILRLQSTTTAEQLVVSNVPEPSTLVLLGMGAVGLIGWAWRRRRRKHT